MDDELEQDDVPSNDLEGLRVFIPKDTRSDDTWAFNEKLIAAFLVHVHQKRHVNYSHQWRNAIRFYWLERKSRRETATELGIGLEAVKSLLKLIRKEARKFLPVYEATPASFSNRF